MTPTQNQTEQANVMLTDLIANSVDNLDVSALPGSVLGRISEVAKRLHLAAEVEVARRVAAKLLDDARLAGCAETSPAAKLRWVAEGRRSYAAGMPEDTRPQLELQIATLEAAARIVDGDTEPLFGLLPSWLWTDEMNAELGGDRA